MELGARKERARGGAGRGLNQPPPPPLTVNGSFLGTLKSTHAVDECWLWQLVFVQLLQKPTTTGGFDFFLGTGLVLAIGADRVD